VAASSLSPCGRFTSSIGFKRTLHALTARIMSSASARFVSSNVPCGFPPAIDNRNGSSLGTALTWEHDACFYRRRGSGPNPRALKDTWDRRGCSCNSPGASIRQPKSAILLGRLHAFELQYRIGSGLFLAAEHWDKRGVDRLHGLFQKLLSEA
jgi:hypothetical protein